MTLRMLAGAAALAAVALPATIPAMAHGPAPLAPIALVEDVKSATAGVEFMDYVGAGQVIRLGAGDTLVLSYLTSCQHETIKGGTVTVGFQQSSVQDGTVVRTKVPCDGGNMALNTEEASKSAATAFRVQSADIQATLFARAPLVQLPRDLAAADRTLLIERLDRPGERHSIKLDDAAAAAGFVDLAKANLSLARGGTYSVSVGGHKIAFRVDANAKSGPAPVVARLLRFP
jgi:hypothetical protein